MWDVQLVALDDGEVAEAAAGVSVVEADGVAVFVFVDDGDFAEGAVGADVGVGDGHSE